MNMQTYQSQSLPWDIVEKAIIKEQKWLSQTLIKPPYDNKNIYCADCIYRRIAILIISGKIKAKSIKSNKYLFGNKKVQIIKSHGKEWHAKMLSLVHNYFKDKNYNVTLEPNLNQGRADLGVFKKTERPLFIEIGSVSLDKLLFNLETMKGTDLLLVLSPKHIIEFSITEIDYAWN